MRKILSLLCTLFYFSLSFGQVSDDYEEGFRIDFNDEGSKYMHFMGYGHFWWQNNEGSHPNDGVSIRRMGLIMFSQIHERFKLVTHIGLSSLDANNLYPTENGGGPHIELIDFYGEYKVVDQLYIGIGKHYFNGITRMNSLSPATSVTIDVNPSSWSTASLSDQGVRHLGMFAKGKLGKLNYNLSVNSPETNNLDGDAETEIENGEEKYLGRAKLGKGKYAYAGYFDYQFLEQESNFLPYRTMTYLGAKKVLNLGAGFFYHPEGIVKNENDNLIGKDVFHIGTDIFYDTPVGEKGGAINFYGIYQYSKMGDHYLNNRLQGNGNQFFALAGYLIPKDTDKNKYKHRFQPYVSYAHRDYKDLPKAAKDLQAGINYYLDGQNAKFSLQYQNAMDLPKGQRHQILVQAAVML